jgi:hypothetical protein
LAAFNEFFGADGQYVLRDQVRRAYSLQPIDRSLFDKEIMKIDERVNICNMIFNGSMARIYPVENHPTDQWLTPAEVLAPHWRSLPLYSFYPEFFPGVCTGFAGCYCDTGTGLLQISNS